MRLIPAPGKLIAEKIEPKKKTEGGIILPDTASDADHPDKLEKGKVLACSPGIWKDGKAVAAPAPFRPDTVVVYQAHAGWWWTTEDGKKYRILDFTDVCAVEDASGTA